MDGWIEDTKDDKWNAIQTVLHEWCLACLTMDLPDNVISSDDWESMDGAVPYHQSWERNCFRSGPVFKWLSDVFIPHLLGTPPGGVPNKLVIFALLPSQASYVNWCLPTLHASIHSISYHSGVPSRDRDRLLEEFASVDRPAVLMLTPALGGTGLKLVAANPVIIMRNFWNLNEQSQAVAQIDRFGQMWTPKAWILLCEGGVDDRPE